MEKTFGIIPASSSAFVTMWILGVVVGLLLIGVIGMFISVGHQASHARFTVTDSGLRIGPGLYGRFIPKEDIKKEGVRVINLRVDKEFAPKWRTNGAGLPGYSAGWFKLANKEKALLFVTDNSRVVYIPTYKKYSVLLSVREAEELAETLRNW